VCVCVCVSVCVCRGGVVGVEITSGDAIRSSKSRKFCGSHCDGSHTLQMYSQTQDERNKARYFIYLRYILPTMLAAWNLQRRMIRCLVENELESVGKWSWPNLK
jgi:hypothetical protein